MPGPVNPIAEVQLGAIAYLFGITNSGTPIAITGLASFELDSDDASLTWKEKENTDTTGNVQNIIQTNFKYERNIKFSPSGTSRTNAALIADNQGSGIFNLTNLVVSNYKVQAFNGAWRIKPGIKVNLKMDDDATIDISCEKYVNVTQNSNLTGAAING